MTTIVRDQLLDAACEATGLDDFGDVPFLERARRARRTRSTTTSIWPDPWAMRSSRWSPAPRQAAPAGRSTERGTRRSRRRLVAAPIFIVGQPRSGSTHLHALLACVDGVRAPRQLGDDGAVTAAGARDVRDRSPHRHDAGGDRPDARRDAGATSDVGDPPRAVQRPVRLDLHQPGLDGLVRHPFVPRLVLRRRLHAHVRARTAARSSSCSGSNPGRWVLKYPKHLLSLDALLAEYPDAVLIWTHRDPAAVIPSVVSLTSFMRQSNDARLRPRSLRARVDGRRGARAPPRTRDARPRHRRARHVDVDYGR